MVELVDYRGRPIRQQELAREEQTSRIGWLRREFADHPSRGLTPAKLATILEDAEHGDLTAQARLGMDMEEKDTHIFAELSKRKRAIMGIDWHLAPPPDATDAEKRDTEMLEEWLEELDIADLLFDLADGILNAYSCVEFDWHVENKRWRPTLHHRPPDWFQVHPEDRNELRLRDGSAEGEALRPWGWIVHRHRSRSGYVTRMGLGRVLAWPYLFRNFSARDLAEFLEIHGLPLRLGKYPPGASDQEKSTLMSAVLGIGHAAAGIIPQGMQIDFEEAAKGSSDPFMAMIEWAEKSVSKAVLGATLTSSTDQGSGAYALGQVHNEVRRDILLSDLRQLAPTITRDLVTPLARLNTRLMRMPRFEFECHEAEDLSTYAKALPPLVRVGMRIPERWAREKLQIPEPEKDEAVLEFSQGGQPSMLKRQALKARPTAPEQYIDGQADKLDAAAASHLTDMIAAVRALIDEVDSLSELRDRLAEAWPELDSNELGLVMGEALTAAELAGRYDLLEELI